MAHFTTQTKQACWMLSGVGDGVSVLIKNLKTGTHRTYLVKPFDTDQIKSLTALEKYCKDEANQVCPGYVKMYDDLGRSYNVEIIAERAKSKPIKPKLAAVIEYCKDNTAKPCNLTTADKLLTPDLQAEHAAGVSAANTPSVGLSPVPSGGGFIWNKQSYTDHQIQQEQRYRQEQERLLNSWAGRFK